MSGVKLTQINKRFGEIAVLQRVELEVQPGEFCVFVGPSGCGKSTLLRIIAGLEEASEGTIHIGGRDVTHIDAVDRGIAMVFQTYALYPHMTVEENMSFGLRMNGVDKTTIRHKVDDVAKILRLEDYMDRRPKSLSGGQRQRVAIGRALVRGPEVFLFDEPLSNLDAELRVDMRAEIARLHQEIGATMIYVTHDQVEAMTLADKIVVLQAGAIEQIGSPMALYNDPDNRFVAGFIGSPSMNFLKAQASAGQISCSILEHGLAHQNVQAPASANGDVVIGLRPEHLRLDTKGTGLTVTLVERLGGVTYVHAETGLAESLIIEHKSQKAPHTGDQIGVTFKSRDLFVFDKDSGTRLR